MNRWSEGDGFDFPAMTHCRSEDYCTELNSSPPSFPWSYEFRSAHSCQSSITGFLVKKNPSRNMPSEQDSLGEKSRLPLLTKALLEYRRRQSDDAWNWIGNLDGRQASKKQANKFFLGAILSYQMKEESVWENARRLAVDFLHDPDDLWDAIARDSTAEWNAKRVRYGLHRYRKGHERVWRIAKELVSRYEGDARNIWSGQTPCMAFVRLLDMRVGEQISRMILGALYDTKQLSPGCDAFPLDVKVDSQVCKVLDRAVYGREGIMATTDLSIASALSITREMNPKLPWLLDGPLWKIGREFCRKSRPLCSECPLNGKCAYADKQPIDAL